MKSLLTILFILGTLNVFAVEVQNDDCASFSESTTRDTKIISGSSEINTQESEVIFH